MRKETEDKMIERLANLEHQQWAHWEIYREKAENTLNDYGYPNRENWRRLRATEYDELTEKEKDSDRNWARKAMEIIKAVLKEENDCIMFD